MNKKEIQIFVTDAKDEQIIDKCEEIALENHIDYGGTLRYLGLVSSAQYIICCLHKNKIVGFMALNESTIYKNDVYIMQVAVKKEFQNMGIGTSLFDYILHHSKQYKYITSNVRKDNINSIKLHKKFGFKLMDIDHEQFDFVIRSKKVFNNKLKITKYTSNDEMSL